MRRISRDPRDVQVARDSITKAVADTVYAAAMVRAIGCRKQAGRLEKIAQKVAAALGIPQAFQTRSPCLGSIGQTRRPG